jgi:molybdopterin molybdotransferase
MIRPEEAWRRLVPHLDPLPAERVARRAARGRVLAGPLAATVDVPAADVSAMDGFALAAPVADGDRLPVAGTVAAGDPPGAELPAGAALAIMTGAPVPAGADRVVPVEDTAPEPAAGGGGAERVVLHRAGEPGANIRRRGEVVRAGDRILPAGALLSPGALALAAAHGHGELPVHRRPRVAVLTTGDEVVPADREPGPGQLRDSHTDFLLAAGAALGLEVDPLGIAPDREDELGRLIAGGLGHDVLLLCGGVSAGEFDFVEGVLGRLGCRLLFDAVAVQPGKPLVAAVQEAGAAEHGGRPGGLVFGLPGNPASVMVAFWTLVRPALRRLMGHPDGYLSGELEGELAGPAPRAKGRDRFVPAEVETRDGRLLVTPVPERGSHDVAAYGRGTALLRIPAGSAPAAPGGRCRVLPIG